MLVNEVFTEDYGRLVTPNVPSFNSSNSTVVGIMDGYDVWASGEYTGCTVFGILDDQHKAVSICRLSNTIVSGCYPLRELWTREDSRGQGFATMLLVFLLRKKQWRLIITRDEAVSDDTRLMLPKLLRKNVCKCYYPGGKSMDVDVAIGMLNQLGKTPDELVLAEEKCPIEMMSNKHSTTGSEWYLIRETMGFGMLD